MEKNNNDFYESGLYQDLFYEGGVSGWATKLMHKRLESFPPRNKFDVILEIGGGEGFHVEFVKENYKLYLLTDIRKRKLSDFALKKKENGQLKQLIVDGHNLEFDTSSCDRVIMMCVLHHLTDPYVAMEEARRVLKHGGLLSIYLPHDPSPFYRGIRKILLWYKTKELGIDYALINAREHKNHFYGIKVMLSRVFEDDSITIRKFPLNFLGNSLTLFSCYQIVINKIQ